MVEEKNIDVKRELTAHELGTINKMTQRRKPHKDIFKVVKGESSGGDISVERVLAKELSPSDAYEEFQARVFAATGAANDKVGIALLAKVADALTPPESVEKNGGSSKSHCYDDGGNGATG